MRKTKVRIVGDPAVADQVHDIIVEHFELADDVQRYDHAVGRDYSHSNAPGVTLYIAVKKLKGAPS